MHTITFCEQAPCDSLGIITHSITARVTGLMPLFDRAIAKSQTEERRERAEQRGLAESDFDLQNCGQRGVAGEGCRQEVVVMHAPPTLAI